ncbi:Glycerate dehydrogenase [Thalassovita autumnalis]|uniref:Glycerate dehydrogenase n=1 Tax=Thalassovita autumnalis TaxID=2072972 RepID=A0A0P1FUG3_9RHOB|nr:D-glycerate dehydrogenase [Thalassovita autumnalis]CUH62907.1 Glycerate dehydrogenase [Thalassovita autumnalis]CUH72160.1 Glycerate dehydrogenase [Thalassovita autumnalis]
MARSGTPRVLISRPLPDAVAQRAETLFDVEWRDSNLPMSEAEMRSALALYDGMMPTLGDKFSDKIFADFGRPRCRILANFGVGYNHIDVEAARGHGVTVTNTPGAVTDATADTAMTLLLMSARRAGEGERLVRSGQWQGWHPTQMLGLHVSGKTVGIVGMGRIGQAIARRCHFGFGMKVLYANRSAKQMDFEAEQVSMLDLAARADVVVVAVPGSAETYHLIDDAFFAAMQSHAHFINIARGDVVKEAALINALEQGQIGGAGLDVYEFEPEVPEALRRMDNVTLLPHLGTAALDVRTDMGMLVLDNLEAFFKGETPPNAL